MNRDAMIERSEEDWKKLEDAIGTLWGLQPGHVLTDADVEGLRHMDTCHRDDEEAATDAYNRGWGDGLRKRGGDELVDLQKRVDDASIAKCTERAMRRLAEARIPAIEALNGELLEALKEIKNLKSEPIGDSGFATGPASLLRSAQEIAREQLTKDRRARSAITRAEGGEA